MAQSPRGVSPWRESAVILLQEAIKYFEDRTAAWLTRGGKINLSAGVAGFTGVLPPSFGGSGTGTGTGAPSIAYVPMIDSAGDMLLTGDGTPILVAIRVV